MPNSLAQGMMAPPNMGAPPGMGPGGPPQAGGQPQKQVTLVEVKDMIHKQAEVARELESVLKSGGPIKPKAVLEIATKLVANRVISAQQAAGYLSDLPDDPNKVREWCERHEREANQTLDQLMQMIAGAEPMPGDPAAAGMAPDAGGPPGGGMPMDGGGMPPGPDQQQPAPGMPPMSPGG